MINCLSGSIKRILELEKINIKEELLCLDKDLLRLGCKGDKDSVSSEIFQITERSANRLGIEIININERNAEKLLNCYPLLVSLDSKILEYSNTFKSNRSNIFKHFICIERKLDYGKYKIFDSYVPGIKVNQFEGIIKIDKNVTRYMEFFWVNIDNYKKLEQDTLRNELSLVNREKVIEHNKVRYNRMKRSILNIININDDKEKKFYLNNMATEIAVGGAKESRYAYELLIKYSDMGDLVISKIECLLKEIQKKYILLRLMLLKSTVKKNDKLYEDLSRIINEIILLESKLKCYKICNY